MLPDSEFSVDNSRLSGLRGKCRECCGEARRRRYRQGSSARGTDVADGEPDVADGEPDVADDEPDVDPASEEAPAKRPRMAEHLYIMALSVDPTGAVCGLKVGRSGDIQQRANALGDTMPFTLVVLATFPGAGHVEKRVHSLLDHRRNTEGRGREWFHMRLPTIIQMVGIAMEQPRDWCQGSTSHLSKG
jgi:hypothetical protein